MHDLPYSLAVDQGPEIVSAMTRICVEAVRSLNKTERDQLLLGVQVLAAANKEAIAIAQSSGKKLSYIAVRLSLIWRAVKF